MNHLDHSEVEVLRKFLAQIILLQKKLDVSYQNDKFLPDRLITVVDIPSSYISLSNRVPRKAQKLSTRIASRLSNIPRTAGTYAALLVIISNTKTCDDTVYTLGHSYRETARHTVKPYGNKGSSFSSKTLPYHARRKTLIPSLMQAVRGCFVCGKDHLEVQRHHTDKIGNATKRLKAIHPSVLLTA